MTASEYRLIPTKPSHVTSASTAKNAAIAAMTSTIVCGGTGQLIGFGWYFSQ